MAATVALPGFDVPVKDVARPDPVRLLETETVAEALSRLRNERIGERVVYFYVTDAAGKLVGVVPTRRLILSDPYARAGEIMIHPVVSVRESEPFGNALQTLAERRLLALPVVDDSGRLKAVLDVSTFTQGLLDLERRESADEVFQVAGIHIEEERRRRPMAVLRNRFPWLLFNMAGGIVAAFVTRAFDDLLQLVVTLAFFVPLVLTLSEAVAMQSVTISLNRLQVAVRGQPGGGIFRELRAGAMLGVATGVVAGLIALLWLSEFRIAAVVAGGVMFAAAAGAAFGFLVPRLVRRWKLDPMIASGPVTLALTDLAALSFYFALSSAVLMRPGVV